MQQAYLHGNPDIIGLGVYCVMVWQTEENGQNKSSIDS